MMKARVISFVLPALFALLAVVALACWLRWGGGKWTGLSLRNPDAGTVSAAGSSSSASTTPITSTPTAPGQTSGQVNAGVTVVDLPGSWPTFRGAKYDNVSTDATPLAQSWGATGPERYWSVDLGEGYAGAAVLQSRVYVLDYDEQARADTLRCFALASGQELWRRAYPEDVLRNHGMSRTVPAVTAKYVVTIGPKCHLLCADALNGDVKWQYDLVKQYNTVVPQWYAGQCPLIDGDKAIIAPGGKALMVAFDLESGKIVWQTPNPHGWQMTHSCVLPIDVQGIREYVYCADQGVVGVSAKDGSLLWETTDWRVSTATVPTPVPVGNDRLFITGGYNSGSIMLQLTAQNGHAGVQTLFRTKPNICSSDQQTPVFYKGNIYAVIAGGMLVCLDLNGNQVWSSGAGHKFGLGPYMIAGGMIYLLDDTGTLTMVAAVPTGFQQLAQAKVLDGHDAWGPMALAGGRLLVRDLTKMVCLDVAKH